MPAPFIGRLCGYRKKNMNPNTSDNSDDLSKELGRELFEVLGVPAGLIEPPNVGSALEQEVRSQLATVRPDLDIENSRSAAMFEQYAHLAVYPQFRRGQRTSEAALAPIRAAAESLPASDERDAFIRMLNLTVVQFAAQDELTRQLLSNMPEEALLKMDVTVAQRRGTTNSHLHVALSSKWSLRTDRAQDCVSQGSKLVALRRGRMPHFAVVTMEPRPSMLKILGDGSGSVDCVYHLHLPALEEAITRLSRRRRRPDEWSPLSTFRRLVDQRRLRDYDELVRAVLELPASA